MYKSPLFVLLAVLVMFVILNGLASLCLLLLDVSVLTVGIGAVLLTLVSCVVVAFKDPTYKVGYWYGFTFAAIAIGSSFNSTPSVEVLGLVIGVVYLATMWATYQLRRWRDVRRIQANFRKFGL